MSANGTHDGTVHNKIVGTVEMVNATVVKVGGEWRNFSKFAADLVPPQRGQRVTVRLDGQGFVRAIEAITDAPHSPVAGRDIVISRLAILKAAAAFGASRPDLKSTDVLRIAESWEVWITR